MWLSLWGTTRLPKVPPGEASLWVMRLREELLWVAQPRETSWAPSLWGVVPQWEMCLIIRLDVLSWFVIYIADPTQSTRITTFRWLEIEEGEEDCRLVRSYEVDCDSNYHAPNIVSRFLFRLPSSNMFLFSLPFKFHPNNLFFVNLNQNNESYLSLNFLRIGFVLSRTYPTPRFLLFLLMLVS